MGEHYFHYRNINMNCEGLHLFSSQSKASQHYILSFTQHLSSVLVNNQHFSKLATSVSKQTVTHNWKHSLKISLAKYTVGGRKVNQQYLFNDAFILQDTNFFSVLNRN